ncbi:MAG: DNA-processing protein DprA [Acidimicrobiales bacterium]
MATVPGAGTDRGVLPEEAYAVALASVPGVGPRTLRALLCEAMPRNAWDALLSKGARLPSSLEPTSVRHAARRIDVAALWSTHVEAGVGVCTLGRPEYPAALRDDPEAPAVLFSLGTPRVVDRAPSVAIVGTRSATRYGLGIAAQLGAELTAAGIVVVSGLARGIDGAAHEGGVAAWRASCGRGGEPIVEGRGGGRGAALASQSVPSGEEEATSRARHQAAPPVAVVAGSVTTPYPRQHAGLWARVAEAGAVVSEAPIGTADLAWRFPARNRIIAALSDVVVVVECHSRGGSLHTVEAAAARGVPVGAVPGSVRSPASAGTNALLADGCFVVRDVSDVLVALGLSLASAPPATAPPATAPPATPPRAMPPASRGSSSGGAQAFASGRANPEDDLPSPTREVASAVGWDRTSLDEILGRTGLGIDLVCGALERLRAGGVLHGEGGWWERE